MRRHEISDEQWAAIEPLLPGKAGDPGRTGQDNRLFVNAVFWIARTGSVAGLARAIRAMEFGLQTVLSLVQKRGLGTGARNARGRRGVIEPFARLDDRSSPPTCGGR